MRMRRWVSGVLVALTLAGAFAPAAVRAEPLEGGAESKVGVVLAIVCGLSLRAAFIQPMPWAGVAMLSCLGAVLDAATEPDTTNGGNGKP